MKNFTRIVLMCVVLCIGLEETKAQYVTIPDANFRNWLNTHGYAGCMNGNQLDTTCSAVVNATNIDCGFSSIANLTGISFFDHLTVLSCDGNLLTFLPALPTLLTGLDCSFNKLTALPALPSSLTSLYCHDNKLTSLPNLPAPLTQLICYGNQLTSVPALPTPLIDFLCARNSITSLPGLPSSLKQLDCWENQLTSLPALPASLTWFDCHANQITSIPALPNSLSVCYTYRNPITSLPTLPSSIKYLWCTNNQLTSLPTLPPALKVLFCDSNQLTVLPSLPTTLISLSCFHNQLTSLPSLADSMVYLAINDNPGLTCLPPIHKISNDFFWSNTGIICLPSRLSVGGTATPSISGIPICPGPSTPTSITVSGGTAKVCPGDTRTYTTPLISGVTYNWIVPTGAVINNGQGTRTINVTYNNSFTSNGTISVTKQQGCGVSAPKTINVNRNIPATPSTISGTTYGLCGATNKTYSITQVAGMTYQWTLPAGASFVNGQGTNSITVNFPNTNFTATVSVKAVNACGAGNARNLTVRAIPSTPVSITGQNTACANQQNVPYSIAAVATATSYNWLVPSGALITSGQGTNSIMMKFGSSSGNVKVRATNACGNSSYRTLAVTINCREGADVNDGNVLVYPNPTNNNFSINVSNLNESNYSLTVRDVIGRVVYERKNILNNGFEFGDRFINGIYIAEIKSGEHREVLRLVKSN